MGVVYAPGASQEGLEPMTSSTAIVNFVNSMQVSLCML